MTSRTILAEVKGFTPLVDNIVDNLGLIDAAVFGRVWRYCQMETGHCTASVETIAKELSLSVSTVRRHLEVLCAAGYLKDETPGKRNVPHIYSDTGKAQLVANIEVAVPEETGVSERPTGVSERPTEVCQKDQPRCVRKTIEDTSLRKIYEESEEETKDISESFFQNPDPQSDRERILHALAGALNRQLPVDNSLYSKWEKALDSIIAECRAITGKKRLDSDLASQIMAAIRFGIEQEEWIFGRADYPNIAVVAAIPRLLTEYLAQVQAEAKRRAVAEEQSRHAEEALVARAQAAAEEQASPSQVLWSKALADLKLQMTKGTFDTWLAHSRGLSLEDHVLIVGVQNEYAVDWCTSRLKAVIERALIGAAGEKIEVKFEIEKETEPK